MGAFLEWLSGKKTYLTTFIFAVFNLGVGMEWWTLDNDVWISVNSILVALGWGFMRAGVAKSGGAAKAVGFLILASALAAGTAQAQETAYWEFEPSLLTGFVKVVENADNSGALTGEVFASAGIGVMYSSLDATDEENITSDFGVGAHLMFGGTFDNFLVTVAVPTLSFFDGFLMVSGTYDFGDVGDRSRFGAVIGTNFEGIIGEVF